MDITHLLAPLAPLGTIFQYVFYEPVYNALMLIFNFFHSIGVPESFGIAIIMLTLILRGALIPLTRKQLKSSREMQVLQPLLKELKEKHKNEPQRMMEEQRRLYKEHGVNPMSGCLPLVIQLPFLYALYGAFRTVLPGNGTGSGTLAKINGDIYPFLPHLTVVPDLHFLWLQAPASLATPDQLHILPILAGILTFIQLRMAMPVRKKGAGKPGDATSQATATMQYIMPFFTVFIGWSFPSGLALYWAISTAFSAVQQYFISGGWGSLFVGIPGLEHLVPPPQDVPSPAVLRATNLNRSSAGASALVAQPSQGGFFGRLREQVRAVVEAQQSAIAQRTTHSPPGGADMTDDVGHTDSAEGDTAGSGIRARPAPRPPSPQTRKRPKSGGAMLVRPPSGGKPGISDATARAIANGSDTSILPEQEIARDATGPAANGSNGNHGSNGKGKPAGSNGAHGARGGSAMNGSRNGSNGTSGTRPAPRPTQPSQNVRRSSGQRPSGSTGKRSPNASGRARDARPKGGR